MATTPLFTKLNLKNQAHVVIINAPQSFETELARLEGVAVLRAIKDANEIGFALAFVTKQQEVDTLSQGKRITWSYRG